jgi:alanine-synthesizing transaminase
MAQARERRRSYIDLTESNPTRAGLAYPPDLLTPLGSAEALRYEPSPTGLQVAREAISGDYRRRDLFVPADRIVVTASTSEAYSLLFKLLCDAGDNVLVPQPSYPLFEHLTRLDAVEAIPYELEYHGSWQINLESLVRAVTGRTRALLVVSPNNPTGSVASAQELSDIGELCGRKGIALIGDEVFADYPLDAERLSGPSVLTRPGTLTFGLGGLSKTVGLPQVKLGWIGVAGPSELVRQALERLEMIGDTYLSVSTPVQLAASQLLADGAVIREQISARIRTNLGHLRALAPLHPLCTLLNADAGWYAVIQVPATIGEEAIVLELLERDGVLVHPGYFFDFPREAFLVLSLLPKPDEFREGVARLFSRVDEGTK